jgi:DNA-binding CsgD family transcriptional regulator
VTINVAPGDPLTPREAEVLRVLAETDSVSEACSRLGIARNTLWTHQTSAMVKLGVTPRQSAWRVLGWLAPGP